MDENVLSRLEPHGIFQWFGELCQHPHGTFHEKPLSDYIKAWAEDKGYAVKQDEDWNLVIDVPATPGYEDAPKVILQGHIDMVCNKTVDSPHNFETDAIKVCVDGDWIHADCTTLGADNGIAVAAFLAITEDPEAQHPALQLVLTASEEAACVGAGHLDATWLDGDYIINMDSFYDDAFMVACAGISANRVEFPATRRPVSNLETTQSFRINLEGIRGGHSGELAHTGRADAIYVLSEILYAFGKVHDFGIRNIYGKGAYNAICCNGAAVICVDKRIGEIALHNLQQIASTITAAYAINEPDMQIRIIPEETPEAATVLEDADAKRLIEFLYVAPCGMITPGNVPVTMADSSATYGVLDEEDGVFQLQFAIRNNSEYRQDVLQNKYKALCDMYGIRFECERRVAAWEYTPQSKLRDIAADAFTSYYGKAAPMTSVHWGVEIATLIRKMEKVGRKPEAIAFGIRTEGAHSPEERVSIHSAANSYYLLREILKRIQ